MAIATALSVAGCGGAAKEEKLEYPSDFAPYVVDFEKASDTAGKNIKVSNLIIKWGDLKNVRERANCVLQGDETPTITVDQSVWDRLVVTERKALLFHEMGHCICKRHHYDKTNSQGNPASIMATYPLSRSVYEESESTYDLELFQNGCNPDASI